MTEILFLGEKSGRVNLSFGAESSGDYSVSAVVEIEGFRGHGGDYILGACWERFAADLASLERQRKGEACLQSVTPGEFEIRIGATDSYGHMAISGSLAWAGQILRFNLPFDPSCLIAAQQAVQGNRVASHHGALTSRSTGRLAAPVNSNVSLIRCPPVLSL